ncbi:MULTISPECIES: DNA cytosine methyltransferase [Pseudomonas]|uniref:DNA cytosine methyltransferase n=1 Tax=Pseudomonas TaxID=286 RepID=UPI0002A1734C|nr:MULTISPECIES: DNA cytosine methyltransferase [Pseudomonas]AGA72610.1 C-5 cytosine-specific DNA methylase [Pseudomonas putida HB3267]MCE0755325.1 DNA cytosine methyltransferase [Pseudomonas asiatica]MCE0944066.1 DNA cytosine methyltransferase [Pseudomonas asiatica]MCE0956037.1 DNA cytosine methyltransferase [Pseudomonas asiatica]MCE1031082.1 DNA cytosine methyltransferase [Pseudomonas asiatica]
MSAFQKKNPLDFKTQYGLGFDPQDDEIVVDFFCGGGGAGTGLEMGLGRPVTVAKNHSPAAISMHTANHPAARHFTTDVFDGDPDEECQGRAVGWFHMSPDCTHHSQAAGGQPRKREIRNLSWIGLKWGGKKKPRVISLENVKQILQWGPLIAKRDKVTGRVMKLDGTVAAIGERVPVQQQFLVPDPKRRGITWRRFVHLLEGMGYQVEWRIIKACDFGAPTSRERLFMIARCDGQPIVWPEPTHAKNPAKGQQKWRTAADCIDWSVPSKSIFGRKKDLAAATLRRVAKGMKKFVLDNPQPFIVPIANWSGELAQSANEPLRTVTSWPRGGSFAVASPTLVQTGYGERTGQQPRVPGLDQPLGTVVAGGVKHALSSAVILPATHQGAVRVNDPGEPMPTVTAANRGELMMASPVMIGAGGPVYAGKPAPADQPMGTLMTQNHRALVTAFIEQANGGFNATPARSMDDPMSTVTNTGSQQRLATASLVHLRGNCDARDVDEPLHTVSAGGTHHGLVEYKLSPEHEEGALRVAAFMISYYGTENISACDVPAPTVTTKDRLGLVTVFVKGAPYVIVDICLRMLQPHELYRAQGFPASYIIDKGADGKPFTKTEQVHMCGNSVSPPPMAALARANDPWKSSQHQAAAA